MTRTELINRLNNLDIETLADMLNDHILTYNPHADIFTYTEGHREYLINEIADIRCGQEA